MTHSMLKRSRYHAGAPMVPAPRNISVKTAETSAISGSARKSQKRFRDTPGSNFRKFWLEPSRFYYAASRNGATNPGSNAEKWSIDRSIRSNRVGGLWLWRRRCGAQEEALLLAVSLAQFCRRPGQMRSRPALRWCRIVPDLRTRLVYYLG